MWISCLSRVLRFRGGGGGFKSRALSSSTGWVLVPEKRDMQLRSNEGTMVNYFEEGLVLLCSVYLDREKFLTV